MEVQTRSGLMNDVCVMADGRFQVDQSAASQRIGNHGDKDLIKNRNNSADDVPKPSTSATLLSSVLHSGNDFLSELHSKLNAALTLVGEADVDDDDENEDSDSGADDDRWTRRSEEANRSKTSDGPDYERSSIAHRCAPERDCKPRKRRPSRTRYKMSSSSAKIASRPPHHRLSLTSSSSSSQRAGIIHHHRSASDTGFVSSAGSVSEAELSEATSTTATGSVSRTSAVVSQESSSFSLGQSASEGSLLSWTSNVSCDSQIDDASACNNGPGADQSMQFMKNFIEKLFKNNNSITLEEKARFGVFCQTEMGRLWFSRYVNTQRAQNKKVDESTFYSLVQYFAIVLFECSEADDYTPAKTLMNMCFTYYHEMSGPGGAHCKEFLYLYLRDQLIWQSLRFWNAAFFDAVQCERAHRPVATRSDVEQYSPEEMIDEQAFQENVTFGQLGSFTCNMHAFGLSRELCLEFLRKQSTIANLRKDQEQMLRDNIERMYRPQTTSVDNRKWKRI